MMDKRQKSILRYSDSIPESNFNEPQDIPHKGYVDKGDVWELVGGIKRTGPAVTELAIPIAKAISPANFRVVKMFVSITNNELTTSDYRLRFNGDDNLNYIPTNYSFVRIILNSGTLESMGTRTGYFEMYCDKLIGEMYSILVDGSIVQRGVRGYTGSDSITSILLYSTTIDSVTDVDIKIIGLKA